MEGSFCEHETSISQSTTCYEVHDYNNPAFAGVKKAADEQSGIVLVQSAWDLVIFKKL